MGFLANGFARRGQAAASEWKSTADTLELFKQVFGSNESATGESITWKSALQVATVLACTRVVANGISQVPLKLFLKSGGSRKEAEQHPLYWALFRKPNPWQSSFEYRQTLAMHLFLCGNHYSLKNEAYVGGPIELIPLEPGSMEVDRKNAFDDPVFTYKTADGKSRQIPAENIWHVKGMSWNGWFGMEPVKMAREAIGLSMTIERQQAKFYKNGASSSGTYALDRKLDAEQYKNLRDWIVENTTGENGGKPLILDSGAKWLQTAMSGIDAQTLESRREQVEEMCRALGVFPQMVGLTDKTATFASAESFFIAHVVHTLAPLFELIEQSIAVNLLTDEEMRGGYYAKFIEEGLLRGSMESTANMVEKYVNGGIMTPNEGRGLLDLNPDADPKSSELRVPANIVGKPDPATTDAEPKPPAAVVEEKRGPDFAEMAAAMGSMLAAAVSQIKIDIPAMPAMPTINIAPPQITVNPPEITLPTINIAPAAVTVNMPEQPASIVNVAPPSVTVEPAQITVNTPDVTVQPAQVTVNTPTVNVSPPNVQVTVEKGGDVSFTEDAAGRITGARMN